MNYKFKVYFFYKTNVFNNWLKINYFPLYEI